MLYHTDYNVHPESVNINFGGIYVEFWRNDEAIVARDFDYIVSLYMSLNGELFQII